MDSGVCRGLFRDVLDSGVCRRFFRDGLGGMPKVVPSWTRGYAEGFPVMDSGVCRGLFRHGLGGMPKVVPSWTWGYSEGCSVMDLGVCRGLFRHGLGGNAEGCSVMCLICLYRRVILMELRSSKRLCLYRVQVKRRPCRLFSPTGTIR